MKVIENSPFTKIFQVCAVVGDAENTAQQLTSLGLGPFTRLPYDHRFTQTQYRGKTIEGGAIILASDVGGVEFEIIQPLGGPSAWTEFLEKRGEGLHHLSFLVNDIDKEEESLVRQGMSVIQKGRHGNGGYSYFETDAIGGVIFEVLQRTKKLEITKVRAEDNPLAVLHQAGSVVRDVDKTADYYTSLGLGPFKKMKWQVTDRWLRGVPIDPKHKLVITQVGDVEFELIQPEESLNVQWEFLNQKGEGLHHVAFFLGEKISDEIEKLVKKGARKSQYGHGPSDAFAFFEPVTGIILELVRRGPQD